MWKSLKEKLEQRDFKSIARAISLVENEASGYEAFLEELVPGDAPVIGITGAPGSGKSTLTDALIGEYIKENKNVAVICVDPSSPFNLGAVLGDRIRMNEWYAHPNVYIRSIGSRGSLGGLSSKILEVTDVLKSGGFDIILLETVGIGQSEVEVAGIADVTILVLVPESGDDVQFMKAGVMEIADIFVINKSDRPGADILEKNLKTMLHNASGNPAPVVKTVASTKLGVHDLKVLISSVETKNFGKKSLLLADKTYQLISRKRMTDINRKDLIKNIESSEGKFNIYKYIKKL